MIVESYQLLSGQHHIDGGVSKCEKIKGGSGKKGSLFSNGNNLQEVPLLGKMIKIKHIDEIWYFKPESEFSIQSKKLKK